MIRLLYFASWAALTFFDIYADYREGRLRLAFERALRDWHTMQEQLHLKRAYEHMDWERRLHGA